jgi:hypothetical protein
VIDRLLTAFVPYRDPRRFVHIVFCAPSLFDILRSALARLALSATVFLSQVDRTSTTVPFSFSFFLYRSTKTIP